VIGSSSRWPHAATSCLPAALVACGWNRGCLDAPAHAWGRCLRAKASCSAGLSACDCMPLVWRAHALEEVRERVPVVEHEVAHAQERELLQAPRPRMVPERALRDAVEREVIVPLQRVLA